MAADIEGHAQGRTAVGDAPCDGGDFLEARPAGRQRTGDLVHQQRAGQPARLRVVGQRHIIGDDDHLDLEAFLTRPLGGQPEVEAIPGVVLDDQQGPGLTSHFADRRQHGVHRRRGEQLTTHGGRQHARADEACVRGFMPRAATGYQRDLITRPVIAYHQAHATGGV